MNATMTATQAAALFFTKPKTIDSARSITIARLADNYIRHCTYVDTMSPTTISTRRTHLKQFIEFCRSNNKLYAEDLTINWLDFYFYEFTKTHAPSTTNTTKRILKSFFRCITDRAEITSVNPDIIKSHKNMKPRPRYIDHNTINHVIQSTTDAHTKMLIDFMYETGLRITEACQISYADIDDLRVYVLGKGNKERTVYLTPEVRQRLDAYVDEWGRQSGTLFRANTKTARLWIQRAFKKYGGIHITPHQLRHSYAARLLLNGCDIASIQKLLGHSDISTTMIYLQLKDEAVENQYYKARNNAQGY